MKNSQFAVKLIFLAFGLGISSWAPMVPYIKDKFQLDDAQLGTILLAIGFGSLLVMPVAGWLIRYLGSKKMIVYGGFFFSILLPLLTIISTPFSLTFVLFLFGAACGIMNISINAQAVEIEAKSAQTLMSGFHCFFSLGGLFGALALSGLLELKLPLPLAALVIAFLIFFLLIKEKKNLLSDTLQKSNQPTGTKYSFFSLNIFLLGMCCFISFMAEGSMLNWSAEFLHSSKEYPRTYAGIGYALFSIAMAFGRLMGDRIIAAFNKYFIFQTGCWTAGCGFLIIVYFNIWYSELLGFCLIGLGISNIVPILFSSAGKISNSALPLVTSLGYIGGLVGPGVIGFLAQFTSLSFALGSLSILVIAMGLCGRFAVPRYVENLGHNG